jgi:hypothetical protein
MKTKLFLLFFGLLGIIGHVSAKEKIYVNSEVTTHIVMPENIKLVDISTPKIIGNQCADNMVRIKQLREFADTHFDVMYLRFARQTRLLSGAGVVVDPVEPDLSLDGMSRMMQIVHDDAVRTAAVAISSKYPEAAKHIMDNVYRGVVRYPK